MEFVEQKRALKNFRAAHDELKNILSNRIEKELTVDIIHGDWTIKDVVAHLAGWNIETLTELKRILLDTPEWPGKFEDSLGDEQYDEFNCENVEARKVNSWDEAVREWDGEFQKLYDFAENLTSEEWEHAVPGRWWLDDTPVTVYSLFTYEYQNGGHEGDHLRQIKHFLK